jgi:prolyl oligopeptidase
LQGAEAAVWWQAFKISWWFMRRRVFASLLAVMIGSAGSSPVAHAAPAPSTAAAQAGGDPYIWLEDVNAPRSLAWVETENKRSLAVLESDPRYGTLHAEALALAQAKDRIPTPDFLNGDVYNFWQDADHVRGLWRRTTSEDYANAAPDWTTVLDLDQLAKDEHANWVHKGQTCALPQERLCLIALSDGGEDATTLREFDLETDRFVDGGFNLVHSKQSADWLDADTILVARDWGPGSLTASGYPFVVKVLHRGQTLSQAQMVFHGDPSDVEVTPRVLVDSQGHRAALIVRGVSFFETETYLLGDHGVDVLSLPKKSSVEDLVAGRLIVSLKEDWTPTPGAKTFAQGSVVAIDLAAARAEPDKLFPTLVWAPGPREALQEVSAVKDRLILTTLDNVRGRAYVLTPTPEAGWTQAKIDLPDNAAIGLVSTSRQDDRSYLSVSSFLAPTSLWLDDAWRGSLTQVKRLPPKFDASNLVTEQLETISKDGTKVPYFVVHRKDIKYDGSNPTLLYAYGGFGVSMTPNYSANLGKLWLERGGVYVLANIRGGGEFGPAWHDAGLNVHRQRIYDDFAAVAEDLIARKITSPRRLGIRGGSNGGLLMGVEFEQHPDLWNAVIIDVPLLDMLHFEQIAAGASWVGEYGSVSNPVQRMFLASISPYNNLKTGVTYPEPFIFTTTKDDRVGPVHARKFAAKMEAMGLPFLYYENTEGGHAAGANLQEAAREQALEMTYLTRKLMD